MTTAALEVRHLSKRFGNIQALDDVSLQVNPGELHALVGENGAGKSTLIKLLAGVHQPDNGSVVTDGTDSRAIAFIHQDLGLVDDMSVAENVALGGRYARTGAGLISWRRARAAATAALLAMGLHTDTRRDVGELSIAEKSMVAIARALALRCRFLVLDEPTAALTYEDADRLFAALAHAQRGGIGILYVTHRLDEVFRIANRVSVLRDGRCVTTAEVGQISPSELTQRIIGRSLAEMYPTVSPASDQVALDVSGLRTDRSGPTSFQLRRGEVLALAGRIGAGHQQVGRALIGDERVLGGRVSLDGAQFSGSRLGAALAKRLAFVSGKRQEESVLSGLSLTENLFCNPALVHRGARSITTPRAEARAALTLLASCDVRPLDPDAVIDTLSGGNQQKVVLARWLATGRKVLVLEEPTAGVDVGARAQIYELLASVLSTGGSVLLISSDFEEVAGLAHRALVFDRGQVLVELAGPDLELASLTHAASMGTLSKAAR
ncbi:MAG: sugar transporter ATP-binding protein [Frankiales bacterium]|nr:sugar transporter ATP-binding protein [Frankiales bacterium]